VPCTHGHSNELAVRTRTGESDRLLAEAESSDRVLISGSVGSREILEESIALSDQHEEAAAIVVIQVVFLEMLIEIRNASGEDRNLNLG
jgi:precorrin-6B methylase 2